MFMKVENIVAIVAAVGTTNDVDQYKDKLS